MTKDQILGVAQTVDNRFPGLRLGNRRAWTEKVAYGCYRVDSTVFLKKTLTGPISDDTLGWLPQGPPLGGPAGSYYFGPNTGSQYNPKGPAFTAVDLLDGTTGAIHWLEFPGIADQVLVIPHEVDLGTGEQPIPPPPSQIPRKTYEEAGGDKTGIDIMELLFLDYEEATRKYGPDPNRSPNPGMGAWEFRCCWKIANEGMTKEAAIHSTRNGAQGWRVALGLDPL